VFSFREPQRARCSLSGESADTGARRQLIRWTGWYWFLIAIALMLIGMRYPLIAGMPEGMDARGFLLALSAGHWMSLTFLLSLLLFWPLAILLPLRRLLITLSIIFGAAVLIVTVADTFVFSLYRFHINGMVLSLVFGDAGSEIFVFGADVWITAGLIIAACMLGAYLLACLATKLTRRQAPRRLGPILGVMLLAVFLLENGWFAWADAAGEVAITSQARYYPLYMPTRDQKFFYKNGLVDPSKMKKRVGLKSGAVDYPKQPLRCNPGKPMPDIFFIAVDSWRYDEIGEKVSPHIAAFAKEAMRFTHHYSGGNNTRTGLFSLFYGLPATYWEAFLDARAGSVLVNEMVKHDYDMAIYASAKLTSPEFNKTIFAAVKDLRTQTDGDDVYARDVKATDEFVKHMQTTGNSPVFGFLFYDAPHAYAVAPQYRDTFQPAADSMDYFNLGSDTDPTPYRNLHRNAVRSADEQVGRALKAIRDSGHWDNSIIIITADHGQEFNDNGLGFWGHNGNFTDAQIRVPLLIKWPGREPKAIDYTTTHYDISTTLLQQVFGCSTPSTDYSLGTSLFSDANRYGFVTGGFGDFAVRLRNRIDWVDKYGSVHALSANNRELSEAPDPRVMVKAMEETSRFYK